MKTIFTFTSFRMLTMTLVIAFSTLNLVGQITHTVAVTDYKYTPSALTITVGDKVIWTNTGAVGHNVNGTTTTFPTNPESFGNDVGLNWSYEFVFNTAGTYKFQCDPHAGSMNGTVVVNAAGTTGIEELAGQTGSFRLYPNPASEYIELLVPANHEKISSLKVYSVAGSLIDQKVLSGNIESFKYDVSKFKNGVYFMEINSGTHKNTLKFLKK